MKAKEIAEELIRQVEKEGLSTDYCYSPDFPKWCKEKAVNRAKAKYFGALIKEIEEEIKNY